ncbi:MAG: hypothetical protein JW925_04530 [Syntrophaceae bacterium]|nr:hypothetical protein [Syntrophaceae bacterium]
MNIEKIFMALEKESDNSDLGIICQQLEEQGYKVFMNGNAVSAKGFLEKQYPDLESLSQVYVCLIKGEKIEQEFILEFTDFHEIAIKRKKDMGKSHAETRMLSNKEIEKAIEEIIKKIKKEMLANKRKVVLHNNVRDFSERKAIQLLKKKTSGILLPMDVLTATTLIYDGVTERIKTRKKNSRGKKKKNRK